MKITFTPKAFDQYNNWNDEDSAIFEKIKKLVKQTLHNPNSNLTEVPSPTLELK